MSRTDGRAYQIWVPGIEFMSFAIARPYCRRFRCFADEQLLCLVRPSLSNFQADSHVAASANNTVSVCSCARIRVPPCWLRPHAGLSSTIQISFLVEFLSLAPLEIRTDGWGDSWLEMKHKGRTLTQQLGPTWMERRKRWARQALGGARFRPLSGDPDEIECGREWL